VRDIFVFLGLMFVVYAGYAVALYSVLYQDRSWDQFTLIDMAFKPYFQVCFPAFVFLFYCKNSVRRLLTQTKQTQNCYHLDLRRAVSGRVSFDFFGSRFSPPETPLPAPDLSCRLG
jgi:hypothetical protein